VILIAGIGNIFLGDDAFGVEVIRELTKLAWPDDVLVKDFGIRGFDLAYALMDEKYETVIMVDALPRGEEPGSTCVIEPDLAAIEGSGEMTFETHGMNPMRVLELVSAMGGTFHRIFIVGCEPESFGGEEGRMGLSPRVTASIPEAVEKVQMLVSLLRQKTAV
jgi:hydrogenase maturation protease